MSSGNSYNGKVCFHWLRIYNNPPSLFGFSFIMYYDITTLNTELACYDYLSIYPPPIHLSIYPSILRSFSIRPRRFPYQSIPASLCLDIFIHIFFIHIFSFISPLGPLSSLPAHHRHHLLASSNSSLTSLQSSRLNS